MAVNPAHGGLEGLPRLSFALSADVLRRNRTDIRAERHKQVRLNRSAAVRQPEVD